ncbi:MAG: DUF3536 domain-containing protein [Desulfobacteraceae bacterium]|nr:DUF3536 domain-containing protein [Desulfobacteraceae bacterium]
MTDKYLCIHGHFYQPPRENPWINTIEYQASASPYHDWNERITRECYGPNTRARLHDEHGHILELINNYEYLSFDFGPTLLSWLEKAHPWIYGQILAADRLSRERFQGHGNALAQVYNHIIMPLATRRDKLTQIRWGLADFKHRFGRPAEGMWLSETAVDTETLVLMAEEGVKFTILSPTQAQSVRPLTGSAKDKPWQDVRGGRINPTLPYRVLLGRGERSFIDVFFYDGPVSRAVAYEKLLASGEDFLARIEEAFGAYNDGPELVSLATDGESYGHHFKFGDLALSWLFHHIEQVGQIKLTNYGLFLENFPPQDEVRIVENSSWSCAHGVERWRADCGCSVSQTPEWNQAWRAPLREGLDWLGNELAGVFEERGGRLFKDPWKARDEYITLFLNSTAQERERFIKRHSAGSLGSEEQIEAFQLLEFQRMALYMFTSCGWFFDDISRLEPVQVLKYAARAVELAEPWVNKDLEAGLIRYLSKARSNDPDYRDGKDVYDVQVRPIRIDPSRAMAHYALAGLAEGVSRAGGLFSETVRPLSELRLTGGEAQAILGQAEVIEVGTGREFMRVYLALRGKTGKLICLVGEGAKEFDLEKTADEIRQALTVSPKKTEDVFRTYVGGVRKYGPEDLIPDTLQTFMEGLVLSLNCLKRDYIRKHDALLEDVFSLHRETGEPVPAIPEDLLSILLSDELNRLFSPDEEKRPVEWTRLNDLTAQAKSLKMVLRGKGMRQMSQDYLVSEMNRLASTPERISIKDIISFLDLADDLNLKPDLWECQNMFYELYNNPDFTRGLGPDIPPVFHELGRRLGFLAGEGAGT